MTDQKTIRNRDTASTVRLVQQQLDELLRRTDALLDENDRYRDALTWIVGSSPAATESQIICARRALGLDLDS